MKRDIKGEELDLTEKRLRQTGYVHDGGAGVTDEPTSVTDSKNAPGKWRGLLMQRSTEKVVKAEDKFQVI